MYFNYYLLILMYIKIVVNFYYYIIFMYIKIVVK